MLSPRSFDNLWALDYGGTHPPSRVPSPSQKSVTPTLRLGGASVWFIHNPNAINICYSFHVHVQRVPGAGFSER